MHKGSILMFLVTAALTVSGCGAAETATVVETEAVPGLTEAAETEVVTEQPKAVENAPEIYTGTAQKSSGSAAEESFVYDVSELTYVAEGEYYYDVASVILYLDEYGELPDNFITKNEAKQHGWQGGSVETYVTGAAIGGDYFGNYEGKLPKNEYHECDIDTDGYGSRGARRLIYSDDGKYYYTKDHYKTFTELTVSQCEEMLSSDR